MNGLQSPRLAAPKEFDSKELYREMFNTPLRREVQPNAGRIQQMGKESYCVAYSLSSPHRYYERVLTKYLADKVAGVIIGTSKHLKCGCNFVYGDDDCAYYIELPDTGAWQFMQMGGGLAVSAESRNKGRGFVESANRLAQVGHIDAALDLIYDRVDHLLSAGRFPELDALLEKIDPSKLTVDVLLGLLTSTLPGKTKLEFRTILFHKVEEEIRRRGEWENGLLAGLES